MSRSAVAVSTGQRRHADHPVDPLFIDRWSTRSLSGEPISDADLFSCFEAARWAPSAFNAQPWRFIYAHRDAAQWPLFLGLLSSRNQSWAQNASALILVISQRITLRDGAPTELGSHAFDAGAAWANFAHQALLLGWRTRAMGGFDRDRARSALGIPDDYAIQAVIAIGRQAHSAVLPAEFQALDVPSGRRATHELVMEGRFRPETSEQRRA